MVSTNPAAEPEVKSPANEENLEAVAEDEGTSDDEDVECSDEVEHEEDEESSAEDTADWDPIDVNADSSKIEKFSLPSHLHPVAGMFEHFNHWFTQSRRYLEIEFLLNPKAPSRTILNVSFLAMVVSLPVSGD